MRLGSVAIASHLGVSEQLADADFVISGESRLDATSARGKVVGTVLDLVEAARVEVAIVAGAVADEVDLGQRVSQVVSLTDLAGCSERSLARPEHYLEQAGAELARAHPVGRSRCAGA